MKKLLLGLAIIFSLGAQAQDTTFYQKRNDLYMAVRSRVIDSTIYKQQYSLKVKKRKRKDRVIAIVTGTIFASISVWFWSGYSR